ncbi:MAG TPA: NUDIX domain-containing protein [Armatimonadota bacterium]|nr:NUDIX domain-containing protein [Armatimonadota bacterium]
MTRDFTVAVFVVSRGCVLLHFHRKLGMWLPPGGHIEPGEIPDDAAIRETLEETGVDVLLDGGRALPVDAPRQLTLLQGIQLEDISPGHQHIDLVYFAHPVVALAPIPRAMIDQDRVGWYSAEALEKMELTHEIRLWCQKALDYFELGGG